VPVYYDPDDPADAVLAPGLSGFHLFICWFLTPFNVILVAAWAWVLKGNRPAFAADDPRRVAATPTGWVVHLPSTPRLVVFLVVLMAITFFGVFAIGFPTGFDPPLGLMAGAWVGAVVLAAVAAIALGWYPTLEVDEVARTLRTPGGTEVPFAGVERVEVAEQTRIGQKGQVRYDYHVELHRADADPLRAATYPDRADADALAAWLRDRLAGRAGPGPAGG
jgi:hypothetical protein